MHVSVNSLSDGISVSVHSRKKGNLIAEQSYIQLTTKYISYAREQRGFSLEMK